MLDSHDTDPPVLIVDDDGDLRSLLVLALRRAGLATLDASSGEEAMAIISRQRLAGVVCDLKMGGMSGLDVVRQIRRRPETATLPVVLMTGSGDADSVIDGLAAGADDFLAKPVRLEELIARVKAHMRTHQTWASLFENEMEARVHAVRAIGRLRLSQNAEELAAEVVAELAERTGAYHVGVFRLSVSQRLLPLARYVAHSGVVRGGPPLPPGRAREILDRARQGPWAEQTGKPLPPESGDIYWSAPPDVGAGAAIYADGEMVGLLTLGTNLGRNASAGPVMAALLAAAIDYASVIGAVAGPSIADRRNEQAERQRLRHFMAAGQHHTVFQAIVDLQSGEAIGYEALTRFADGVGPDVRFAEAKAAGIGVDLELAALRTAIEAGAALPPDKFLALNVSPEVLLTARRRLVPLLDAVDRQIVLEVTEHSRIGDYKAFKRAIERLPRVSLAVDDAGAGYSSLGHILELAPAFSKLDMSLVRGIDNDPRREALVAGLVFFAASTGCSLIAEGVEGEEEADVLRRLGVRYAQGYLFGRPAPLKDAPPPAKANRRPRKLLAGPP